MENWEKKKRRGSKRKQQWTLPDAEESFNNLSIERVWNGLKIIYLQGSENTIQVIIGLRKKGGKPKYAIWDFFVVKEKRGQRYISHGRLREEHFCKWSTETQPGPFVCTLWMAAFSDRQSCLPRTELRGYDKGCVIHKAGSTYLLGLYGKRLPTPILCDPGKPIFRLTDRNIFTPPRIHVFKKNIYISIYIHTYSFMKKYLCRLIIYVDTSSPFLTD